MSTSITENIFSNQIESMVRNFVKENLEVILKEEFKNYFEVEHPELKNSKNGYYERGLDTRYGRIEDLSIPRDREGHFQTNLFDPYQRRERWLGESIITMYHKGFSTREIGTFIERILGDTYSATTVSNITDVLVEEIEDWQQRPLEKRYSVLYLDGTYLKVRRQDVDSEVVYVIVGITDEGNKEIVGFCVGGKESALGWKEILTNLRNRGLEEVLLGVFDGLSGLEKAFKEVYPRADVQRCVVHKVRNVLSSIRQRDKETFTKDLKKVYKASSKEQALHYFSELKGSWNKVYPKVISSWEEDLSVLLTFLDYPKIIQPQIYTTNTIERTIKEVKKRTKSMNSLPSEKAVEKIVYLVSKDYNERWSKRSITEFASARNELKSMFESRYGSTIE
ncbi:IS256 family transposase [Oceanobacillus jordanicus]|uniref:Mutator family transposase n=1 Tax=Oceanobacillus jordanicus TaxID=2867266 RepID=A0AAW5B8S0_9BACI|nr:IS256 family transposase [Oceanobacillus jordanicus]MCG3419928.1 IS256 family transposase [Oceanobacillus jordanicus]